MRHRLSLWGFAFIIALIPDLGYAQFLTYDLGIKAGVNSADLQSSSVGGGERRSAYVAGGFIEVDLGRALAVQAELLYTQKGDESKVRREGPLFKLKLDYLEMPVLLKLQGPLLGNAEASVYGGPAFAYKLSESTEGLAPGTRVVGTVAKSVDFGTALGMEFGFGFPEGRILIDLRFTPGWFEIRDNALLEVENQAVEFPQPDATNSVFSIMVGFAM